MSDNKYMSVEDVKKYWNVQDFRRITKEQIIEFTSMIPHMNKEVAIACINQFPDFAKNSVVMIEHLSSLCQSALEEGSKVDRVILDSFSATLESCRLQLTKDDLSFDQQQQVIDRMVYINEKMAEVGIFNKQYNLKVLDRLLGSLLTVLIAGAGILGFQGKIPINLPTKKN